MQDTEDTTITSRRSKRLDVALWRRRSISSFIEQSFSINVIYSCLSVLQFFLFDNRFAVDQDCEHFVYYVLRAGIRDPVEVA